MKKFLVKLVGVWDQRRGKQQFHQPEVIEHDNAEVHRKQAMRHDQEWSRETHGDSRTIPSDNKIIGPSESEKI